MVFTKTGDTMHMNELIIKKRNGLAHTKAELKYIIDNYVKGDIPDYQMSAWLMAVYFRRHDRYGNGGFDHDYG